MHGRHWHQRALKNLARNFELKVSWKLSARGREAAQGIKRDKPKSDVKSPPALVVSKIRAKEVYGPWTEIVRRSSDQWKTVALGHA